jgi:hypothetical protein
VSAPITPLCDNTIVFAQELDRSRSSALGKHGLRSELLGAELASVMVVQLLQLGLQLHRHHLAAAAVARTDLQSRVQNMQERVAIQGCKKPQVTAGEAEGETGLRGPECDGTTPDSLVNVNLILT